MGDQAERIVLEAEDQVTPVVDKANAGLERFEQKAESTHGKVIRITDQTRSSVQRLIASLEKQAETYGKSGVDRLISQRDQLLQRYAKEPAAIDAITKSYERMIAVEQKLAQEAAAAKAAKEAEEALKKQSAAIRTFGDNVTQFMQNPLQGARGAITSTVSAIGPFGVGVAAGATALIGFAAAGFQAAKALADYGVEIKDVQLRTGLTAQEVGQFGFAAKAVGQDVSIFERTMRGLTVAVEDQSRAGEKARKVLQQLGVDVGAVRDGTASTSDVLLQISRGLGDLPSTWERNQAALTLFKRAGIEAIPVMLELNENVKRARELGLGPTQAEVDRFAGYQKQLAETSALWDRLVRKIKEPISVPVLMVLRWALAEPAPGSTTAGLAAATAARGKAAYEEDYETLQIRGYLAGKTDEYLRRLRPGAPTTGQLQAPYGKVADQQAADAAVAAYLTRNKDLASQLKDAEEALKLLPKPEVGVTSMADLQKYEAAENKVGSLKKQIEAAHKAAEELSSFRRSAAEFEKKGDESELSAIAKIYYQRDLLLAQAAKVKATEAEIAAIRKAADEQAMEAMKKAAGEFEKHDQQRQAEQWKTMLLPFLPSKTQLREWDEGFTAQERIEGVGIEAQREVLRRRTTRAQRMAEFGASQTPRAMSDAERREVALNREAIAAEQAYQTRVDLAIQLAAIETSRILKEENAANRAVLAAQAQKDLYTELAQAQDQVEEKRAAVQQKHAEELQRQVDELQKVSSGLLHTLFTKPGDFPKELASTIREATLRPVEQGLGGMVANALHPLIFGGNGQGGIAGIFQGAFGGPKQDPLTVTSDNTNATKQNSNAIWLLTAVLSELMGRSVPGLTAEGGAAPNIGVASPSGFLSQALRNTGGLPRFAEGGVVTGPSIVGEAGPELVVPLNRLRNFGLPGSIVGTYGPETDAALQRVASAGVQIGLAAALSGVGGPGAVNVGQSLWSLLLGGVGAATPATKDGVLLGMLPIGSPGSNANVLADEGYVSRSLARRDAAAWPSGMFERENGIVKGGLWAVNPKTGGVRLSKFSGDAFAEEHTAWFDRIGLPSSGPEFDRIPRGRAYVTDEGKVNLVDETWGSLLTNDVYRKVQRAIVQRANPGTAEAGVRGPRDLVYIRGKYETGERNYFNMSEEQLHAAGSKGGRAWARRLAKMTPEEREALKDPNSDYQGPEPGPFETTHEAGLKLDAMFPRFRDIVWKENTTSVAPGQGKKILVGDRLLTLNEAGLELNRHPGTINLWLKKHHPGEDWTSFDLLSAWPGARKLPSHAEGGTIANTGLALVHGGEAVVPQADTLKRSIDNLTFELHSTTGVLGWFVNSMVQPMFGGRAPALPIPIPGVGTVKIPSLFGGGGAESGSATTVIYMPSPAAPAEMGAGAEVGPAPVGEYAPGGGFGTGGGTASYLNPLALANMVSGQGGGKLPGSGFNPSAMFSDLKHQDWGGFTRNKDGGISGMHGMAGAAVFTGGVMLAQQGLLGSNRGTWGGVGEGVAGGAAAGFAMGGPLGAGIGAAAGFGIGVGEMLAGVKSPEREAHDDIKAIYGVDIPTNSGTIKQIVEMAKSQFGNNISAAVRAPSARQLVMLYSEATGQRMPLSAATPYGASLVEQGGSLYQQASFQNNAWHTYQSSLPTLGGITGTSYPVPAGPNVGAGAGGTTIALNINGTPITPEFVMDQSMLAQGASYGRTQQAANMQVPGLMVA